MDEFDTQVEASGEAEDDEAESNQVLETFLQDKLDLVLDTKDLCIAKKELVWVLHVEVSALAVDGNFKDAALLAMVAALENGEATYKSFKHVHKLLRICTLFKAEGSDLPGTSYAGLRLLVKLRFIRIRADEKARECTRTSEIWLVPAAAGRDVPIVVSCLAALHIIVY
jgi:hypothetical protein